MITRSATSSINRSCACTHLQESLLIQKQEKPKPCPACIHSTSRPARELSFQHHGRKPWRKPPYRQPKLGKLGPEKRLLETLQQKATTNCMAVYFYVHYLPFHNPLLI